MPIIKSQQLWRQISLSRALVGPLFLLKQESPWERSPILFCSMAEEASILEFFLVRGTFQTMRPNEFVVDKFTHLFVEHNFGSLLFNTKHFKPELKIYQSIGWGMLGQQQRHRGIPIQDMSKGYFESGIMLANLLRLPILNFGYFGLGVGLFMRYGPYWIPTSAWDNMAIKIDMNVSF